VSPASLAPVPRGVDLSQGGRWKGRALTRGGQDYGSSNQPPAEESHDSWRARLREQQPAEPDVGKEEVTVQRAPPAEGVEPAKSDVAPAGSTSSPEEENSECSLQVQVASFAELTNLTRENREALEGIRRLVGKTTAGSSSSGTEVANEDKLRELERLIAMAKVLEEMAVSAGI